MTCSSPVPFRTCLLLAACLMGGLLVGCDTDPRYGADGQLLEACDVTREEIAVYDQCQAATSQTVCTDSGGSWTSMQGDEMYCFCSPPTSGCPCRDEADCEFGSCISQASGSQCGSGLGTCETPAGCWCDVEAGAEICF